MHGKTRHPLLMVIGPDDQLVGPLLGRLEGEGLTVVRQPNVYRTVADFARAAADMVLINLDPLTEPELECIRIFREINPEVRILATFSYAHRPEAAKAVELGADTTLLHPFYPSEPLAILRRWAGQADLRQKGRMDYHEHLASLAQLAKGTAHEINNPLTTLAGWLEMMEADAGRSEEERKRLASMRKEAERIAGVVKNLLAFGEEPPSERREVALDGVLSEVVAAEKAKFNGVKLDARLNAPEVRVPGDENLLRHAFSMLLSDALAACNTGDAVSLESRLADDGSFEVRVRDEGRRIPKQDLERLFEPYLYPSRGGEPISLLYPAVHGIIRSHGGDISAFSGEQGTEFLLRLPTG